MVPTYRLYIAVFVLMGFSLGEALADPPPAFFAGEHAGRLRAAERICPGRTSDSARAALERFESEDRVNFEAGTVFGEAEVNALRNEAGAPKVCAAMDDAYGEIGAFAISAWRATPAAPEPRFIPYANFGIPGKVHVPKPAKTSAAAAPKRPDGEEGVHTLSTMEIVGGQQPASSRIETGSTVLGWTSKVKRAPDRAPPAARAEASPFAFARPPCALSPGCKADHEWCGC